MNEMREQIPAELQNFDRALQKLADCALNQRDALARLEGRVMEGIKKHRFKARVISMVDDEPDAAAPRWWAMRRIQYFLIAAAALLIGALLIGNYIQNTAGLVDYKTGLARIIRSGRAMASASTAERLRSGDILETANGAAAATLDNRAHLLMNEETRVSVAKQQIDLSHGEVWLYVVPGSGNFAVQTPSCSIHVVGTSFGVTSNETGVAVFVSNGKVVVRSGSEDVAIHPGEKIFLPKGSSLAGAQFSKGLDVSKPPVWVGSLLEKISADRWEKFFPSAVPIKN